MRRAALALALIPLAACGPLRARLEAAADAAFRAGIGVMVAETHDPKARARRRSRTPLPHLPSRRRGRARLPFEVSR